VWFLFHVRADRDTAVIRHLERCLTAIAVLLTLSWVLVPLSAFGFWPNPEPDLRMNGRTTCGYRSATSDCPSFAANETGRDLIIKKTQDQKPLLASLAVARIEACGVVTAQERSINSCSHELPAMLWDRGPPAVALS
jgi:hypothetical protein